jgi:hypothetical protein
MDLIDFEAALAIAKETKGKTHLLLGNGFSIALKPDIFTYNSLFSKANFSAHPEVQKVFERLDTTDFEQVVYTLEQAAQILTCYLPSQEQTKERMEEDALRLKEILVETIAGNHPPRPYEISEDQYASCTRFLKPFLDSGSIYTLNYDILLYWTLMNAKDQNLISFDDGFRSDPLDLDAEYVVWDNGNAHGQNVHYLHGALHLFDAGHQLRKYTWNRTDIPLVEQSRKAISDGAFPLFVSEGSTEMKMTKISHSGYLHKALRSFSSIGGSLFIHGLSLAPNDEHILQRIERGKLQQVFIGIHGDPGTAHNQKIVARASRLLTNRGDGSLKVHYYSSSSAKVWG